MPGRRFRFLKKLSEGTFARVYLAELSTSDGLSRIVAVKVLREKWTSNPEIVRRTRDEARVLGRLHHRSIVKAEDLTAINGQCAIIMEYLEGIDLKHLVAHCKEAGLKVPRQAAFEIVGAVAQGLEVAYNGLPLQGGEALRLVHRDIKPSNVMLTPEGDVKILDFGTVRAVFEARESHTKALTFGSQGYMAPERMLGEADTAQGDVFSLGVTLFEVLTLESFGRAPLRPQAFEEMLHGRLDAMDLLGLDTTLGQQIRQTLQLLMSYDPERRPTAARTAELMDALGEVVGDGELRRFARATVPAAVLRMSTAPAISLDGVGGDGLAGAPVDDALDPLLGTTVEEDALIPEGLGQDGSEADWLPPPAPTPSPDALTTLDMPVDDPATIDDMGGSPFTVPPELEARAERAQLKVDEPVQAVRPSQTGMLAMMEEAPTLDPSEWEANPTEIAKPSDFPIPPMDSFDEPDDTRLDDTKLGGPAFRPVQVSQLRPPTDELITPGPEFMLDPSEWEVAPTVVASPDAQLPLSEPTRPMSVPQRFEPQTRGGHAFGPAPVDSPSGWTPPPTHSRWITSDQPSYAGVAVREPTGEVPVLPSENVHTLPPSAWSPTHKPSPAQKAKDAVRRARSDSSGDTIIHEALTQSDPAPPENPRPILPAYPRGLAPPKEDSSGTRPSKDARRDDRTPSRTAPSLADGSVTVQDRAPSIGLGWAGFTLASVAVMLIGMALGAGMLFLYVKSQAARQDATDLGEPLMSNRDLEGIPGGVVEVGTSGGDRGNIVLKVNPPASASVVIWSALRAYKETWSSQETLELRGLPSGIYQTKISPLGSPSTRSTVEVLAAQTCTYRYDLTSAKAEWKAEGCE